MATDRKDRVNVNARVPKGLSDKIDRFADDEDRDRSNMVRVLLKEAIAAREAAIPQ